MEEKYKRVKTHTIHYGYICDGEETVDEVLVMVNARSKNIYRRRHGRN